MIAENPDFTSVTSMSSLTTLFLYWCRNGFASELSKQKADQCKNIYLKQAFKNNSRTSQKLDAHETRPNHSAK
jgi:hypothetical protein